MQGVRPPDGVRRSTPRPDRLVTSALHRVVEPPTDEDRLAYRAIVWAHGDPFGCRPRCPHGLPGCPTADWLMRFAELGWIELA